MWRTLPELTAESLIDTSITNKIKIKKHYND